MALERACLRSQIVRGSQFVLLLTGLCLGAVSPVSRAAPNLVVILLDDLSVDAMQTMLDGNWLPETRTHLIDQGVRFENAFVTNSECCPSRATLLTGQYSHNHLVIANHGTNPLQGGIAWDGWLRHDGQPGREDSTIAVWLQAAGYRTGFIGKYLNGYGDQAPADVADPRTYVPAGWDEWNGLIGASVYRVYDYDINDDGVPVHYGEAESDYQTDVLANRAVAFIESGVAQAQPFFLLVAPLAPHIEVINPVEPIQGNDPKGGFALDIRPAPRHLHLIDGDPENGELPGLQMKPSFNEADLSDKPSCPRELPPPEISLVSKPSCIADRPTIDPEVDTPRLEHQYKSMLASLIAVDDLVGRIVASLSASGEFDNTAILLTSDNGWFYGEHRVIGKELAYEESIRVPMILRTPSGQAGMVSQAVVLNNDIAPTLAALGGATTPYEPDGASLLPLVELGAEPWFGRKRFLVERWYIPSLLKYDGPTYLAMRALDPGSNFTYIATRTDPDNFNTVTDHELYVLDSDPFQLQSIELPPEINTSLDNFLIMFRGCKGTVCRAFESF